MKTAQWRKSGFANYFKYFKVNYFTAVFYKYFLTVFKRPKYKMLAPKYLKYKTLK